MRAHFAAVKTRLDADAALAGKGHDSARLQEDGSLVRDTYWILYGGAPESLGDERLTAPQLAGSDAEYVYTFRAISVTADGCRKVAQKAIDQLVGFSPVIAGRNCQAIRLDRSGDVEPENSVSAPLYYLDLDFLLKSSRA